MNRISMIQQSNDIQLTPLAPENQEHNDKL